MSEIRNKSKKVVNSIGVGIMAVLSTGTSMLQIASAADVGEVQNAGEMLENEVKTTSMNQGSIDALDNAGDAINTAQGSVSEAGDIQNGKEIQGELNDSAEALGDLNEAVEKLEDANAAAAEAIEDYQYAVDADQYRDGAAENIDDAKAEAGDAQTVVAGNKEDADDLAEANKAAQENQYGSRSEAESWPGMQRQLYLQSVPLSWDPVGNKAQTAL